ncbi:tetratricopeptide repeat protein [Streptacidiphilus neutrinimicus]|uniref:tetratricopeptide repeat protein n=1 Tax=Streptacidiphilus neutrinimicus TaxID=105420 RepID=UPI000AFB76BA|nr:tetratricopeptide repeat protein [Streptacidiphilus neutrinimicus]
MTIALGVGLFLAGGLALAPWQASPGSETASSLDQGAAPAAGDPLSADIASLQAQLRQTPTDAQALAALGLEYVQQAKNTADPSYYPKAEAALQRSLALQKADNFTAEGGMAALENARHHFTAALGWARQAVAVNPYNSTLFGTLADAYTQLGRYDEAADAVQRMVDLRPGAPSLARASYVAELRGDIATARHDMQRALQDSGSPTDQAFAYYYLGQLAFNNGDPSAALAHARQGLAVAPTYTPLLQAKAQAEAALGQTDAAITDLTQATARVPQPEYVLQLGELDQSLGRTAQATEQYQLFRAEQQLFTDNGVTPDSDAALFEADHGNPQQALAVARAGLKTRPFLETHDALAWALYLNHLDRQALAESDQALAQGTRNALFHYHRALIQLALGDTTGARTELTTTLAINPYFNPLDAPRARALLSGPDLKTR